jgi:hypothetical protein
MATPVLRSAWLLYASTIVSAIAVVLGVIIAPGVRGVASDKVVSFWQTFSAIFSNSAAILLIGLMVLGIYELLVDTKVAYAAKGGIMFGSAASVVVASLAFVFPMANLVSVLLILAACLVAGVAGSMALRSEHTRAGGMVVMLLAVSALLRLIAWRLAVAGATEPGTYATARGFATASVVCEGFAQAATVVWVGMRGRWVGQVTTPLALAGAFFIVWSAGQGRGEDAPQWKMALWGSLGWLPPPEPFALSTLAVYFGVSAPLLALAALVAVRKQGVMSASIALAILARGMLDVPLRSLFLCAAAIWMVLTTVDDRAMWRARVDEKKG